MLTKNFNGAKQQLNLAIMEACEEMAKVGTAQIQAIAPVGSLERGDPHPGNLRRSYGYRIENQGKAYVIMFGSNVDYAIYVEMKPESRGGRPHLRKAIESEIDEFRGILSRHLGGIG